MGQPASPAVDSLAAVRERHAAPQGHGLERLLGQLGKRLGDEIGPPEGKFRRLDADQALGSVLEHQRIAVDHGDDAMDPARLQTRGRRLRRRRGGGKHERNDEGRVLRCRHLISSIA